MTPRTHGFTLLELLIGLALALVTLAAATGLCAAGIRAWQRVSARADALAAVTDALDSISRDVRLAGYDPQGRGLAGLTAADASGMTLMADLDGDGAIDERSDEQVAYRWSRASAALLRVVGRQAMVMLPDVPDGGFRLRYFDADGVELDPQHPDAADEARRVAIEIETRAARSIGTTRIVGGARVLNR